VFIASEFDKHEGDPDARRSGSMEVVEVFYILERRALMRYWDRNEIQRAWMNLESAGIPLEDSPFRDTTGIREVREGFLIEQQGDQSSSMVMELASGRLIYMVDIMIVNRLHSPPLRLRCYLDPSWDDRFFQWLPDPAAEDPSKDAYTFRGAPGLEYHRKLVLNHRLATPLERGGVLEGLLLATGCGTIPPSFTRGHLDVTLRLIDQFDREYCHPISMWIDRSDMLKKGAPKQRVRLFEKGDLLSEDAAPEPRPVDVKRANREREAVAAGDRR